MNTRAMSDAQIGLILMGLQTIYVQDREKVRTKMIEDLEAELATRGKRLAA